MLHYFSWLHEIPDRPVRLASQFWMGNVNGSVTALTVVSGDHKNEMRLFEKISIFFRQTQPDPT